MNQQGNAADEARDTGNHLTCGRDEVRELLASIEPRWQGGVEWLLDWIETREEGQR